MSEESKIMRNVEQIDAGIVKEYLTTVICLVSL